MLHRIPQLSSGFPTAALYCSLLTTASSAFQFPSLLLALLSTFHPSCLMYVAIIRIAVICRADDLSSEFALAGIECQCIHGGREQSDREAALNEFRDGSVKILIATDVASRGLDIPDIRLVKPNLYICISVIPQSQYVYWIGVYLSFHFSWVLRPFFRWQNRKTS